VRGGSSSRGGAQKGGPGLATEQRLKKSAPGVMPLRTADFRRVFKKGWSGNSTHFQIHILDRFDGRPARVGVVVSRKHGGAVARNRIRRRVKEVVRTMSSVEPGIDLVILPRRGADEVAFPEIARELSQIMANRTKTNEVKHGQT